MKIKGFGRALTLGLAVFAWQWAGAVTPGQMRHHSAADTLKINQMLKNVAAMDLQTPSQRVAAFGRSLLGTPYVAHTLESPMVANPQGQDSASVHPDSIPGPEMLVINVSELDCTTFVETCAALAMTLGQGRDSWRDYAYNLERLRYRGGHMDGYPSRLHYIAAWVLDNSSRGLIKDVTDLMPSVRYNVKTIDFMSRHRDRYPALADSANFARVLATEQSYRGHRYPYLRSQESGQKQNYRQMRSGDIVALTSNVPGLDVTHMGMIILDDTGVPHLLHASQTKGQVVLESDPLHEFLRRNRQFTGLRLIRVLDY